MTVRPMNYDELASNYGPHRRPNPAVLEVLQNLASEIPDARLLEIGVGTGNFATALSALVDGSVFGIDPSREMLRQIAGGITTDRVARGRAERLPFAGDQFSMLYSVDVIHHVRDRDAAAAEAFRVLRAGGLMVIVTDSEEDIARRVPLATYFPETLPNEIERYPRIESLEAELQQAGFEMLERRHTLTKRPLTDIAPYRYKAFSSLHLITEDAFSRGLAALEAAFAAGPIDVEAPYTLVIGRKPLS